MEFSLTTRDPFHSDFCRTEGDITQVIYRTVSPFKFKNRHASIDKVITTEPNASVVNLQDQFERIGEVDFRVLDPSIITFWGKAQGSDTLFKRGKAGWLSLERIFTGPDGKEYRWTLGARKPNLYLNDEAKTKVATFNPKGISPTSSPATLVVYPAGEHMVDLIVVMLVYIEIKRRDHHS